MVSVNIRGSVLSAAARAKDAIDVAVLRGKQATGMMRPLRAWPYLGHGTPQLAHIKGRVREQTGVTPPKPTDGPVQNLAATVRRFTATPLPSARVRVRVDGNEVEVCSDADGYFRATVEARTPLAAGWHDVSATLLTSGGAGKLQAGEPTASRVLVPPLDADFGIISDLDDTVLRSEVTNPLRAAATVLLSNATTRMPFEGVAAFYRALRAGPAGAGSNPLFYVSSGPWNLYDLITAFLESQEIPAGPLFLRAWGLDADALPGGGHRGHKSELIAGLLETYPRLRFVLIGDSGQEDPEIYRAIALASPDRILAVYIRDVTTPERDGQVQAIASEVSAAGVPCRLVSDTAEAARHAVECGLISPAGLAEVVDAGALGHSADFGHLGGHLGAG